MWDLSMILSALISPDAISLALITFAYAPSPSNASTSKSLILGFVAFNELVGVCEVADEDAEGFW